VDAAGTGWTSKAVKEEFSEIWPRNAVGNLMCLPFHHRGSCYTQCGRSSDHAPQEKANEDVLMVFLEANFTKYQKNL